MILFCKEMGWTFSQYREESASLVNYGKKLLTGINKGQAARLGKGNK